MKKSKASPEPQGYKVSPNMQRAALLIAQGKKLKDVAEACDISPQTLSEWRSNEVFQILCNQIQKNVLESSEAKIVSLATKAVNNLESMLDSKNEKVKFDATKEVLRIVGLDDSVTIGKTTLQRGMFDSCGEADLIPMTEDQLKLEAALKEAAIVED